MEVIAFVVDDVDVDSDNLAGAAGVPMEATRKMPAHGFEIRTESPNQIRRLSQHKDASIFDEGSGKKKP